MPSSLVEFSNDLANAVERAGGSIIAVLEGGRDGVSGTVWKNDIAVTAEHTIRGYDEVTVVLPNGEQAKAKVAGRDPGTDIAILRLPSSPASASFADESQSRVGEVVLSVARRGTEGLATSYGIVSAISGPWRTWQGARVDRWFRLDLNPYTGFSGGPIVNARGDVLGIATSGPRRSVVVIPTSTVNRVVDQLLKRGRVARAYLGIGVQPVAFPEATRQSLGLAGEHGLLIVNLSSGSSAEKSGLLLGDILVSIGGTPVHSIRSLQSQLDPENIGKAIPVEAVRGGQLIKLSVTIGERPEN